mgnify:CR=1 FL=1
MLQELAREIAAADPVKVALAITFLAGGALYLGWRAFRSLHNARIIVDIPTSKARSAHQGYVELEGVGRLMDGQPIVAPLSGLPCVWYRYQIEERVTTHSGGRTQRRWVTVERGQSDEVFWLEDDTGRVAVDPEGAEVTPRHKDVWHSRSLMAALPLTTAINAFLAAHTGSNPYRFTEERIKPGDPVYALGLLKNVSLHADAPHPGEELRQLLAEWKKDQPQLKERFDLNRDGRIDDQEWMLARAQARREAERTRTEHQKSFGEGINLLRHPNEPGRPYLISAYRQSTLVRRYYWQTLLTSAGFFLAGAAAVWAFNVRFG